ncbi:MAG: dTMP kinase [Planctomycetota bacterium]|nr:dTMP kinase [Planctomycetota bacterium]
MSETIGRLIVLEGVDDVGKSTIAVHLANGMKSINRANVLAFPGREPGSVGKWVYDLHHDPERQSINQTCLQLLHVASHIDCIETQIRPLIQSGHDVILDRYWWSTYAYGVAGGVEVSRLDMMIQLEKAVWGDCKPDCIALLRRREAEQIASAQLVREYEGLFHREQSRCRAIEVWNDSDVESAVAAITNAAFSK